MNTKVKNICRIVWIAIALVATVFTITDHAAFANGDGFPSALFFTSWSVWISLLAALVSFCLKSESETVKMWKMLLKFSAIIMMIATFVVSAFVLPDKIWKASYWNAGSIFKHFLLPIITVADTIMFDEKGSYKVWFPFGGLVAPLAYWIVVVTRFVTFRNANGGSIPESLQGFYYPYGFTNLDAGHSLAGLIRLLAIIMVALIAVGYAFVLGKKAKK